MLYGGGLGCGYPTDVGYGCGGVGYGSTFIIIVVLFILLIIIGTAFIC